MATARRLNSPATAPNLNVAGPPVITLELDENEAGAIQWYLMCKGRSVGEVADERQRAAAGTLSSGSLAAAAIRVGDALSKL